MTRLYYKDQALECRDDERVLDACLRQGVEISFSCRGGTCQNCLSLCVDGEVPAEAQRGLKPELVAKGYFLPCVCAPTGDMRIEPPRVEDIFIRAEVSAKTWLSPTVCRIALEPHAQFAWKPGQFINLRRDDGLTRSYSLASHPEAGTTLELHVKRMEHGAMSNWLCDQVQPGDTLDIQGPNGDFHYAAAASDQPLLLIATGTGLAPALGVIRDALAHGHGGRICLYHGVSHAANLYLHEALLAIAAEHPNVEYHPCASSESTPPPGVVADRAHVQAVREIESLSGWRVYLAGLPAMVSAATALVRQHGAAAADVVTDPFEMRDLRSTARIEHHVAERAIRPDRETPQPGPDAEIWAALDEGRLLRVILDDFYTRVFADPLLAPYFHGTTKQRAMEKVYSFLHQVFTGNKVFFGDRPTNSHHWMVISNEIFDYREDLFVDCLRRHGLPSHLIKRWREMEERYRPDIVKSAPWKRVAHGVEMPLDGFGEVVMEVGSVCDSCAGEIAVGDRVRYHLRLGTTYCPGCSATRAITPESALSTLV